MGLSSMPQPARIKRCPAVSPGCCWLLMFCLAVPQPIAAKVFDYLYIDASEGNASGGHVAVRFGDAVFHYQHVDHGLIRLIKNDLADFEFLYRYRQNRSIYLSRIKVSEAAYTLLRDHMIAQTLLQDQQFSLLDKLQQDRALLRWLRDGNTKSAAAAPLRLAAAGLFYSQNAFTATLWNKTGVLPEAGSIVTMRQEIGRRYGRDFLQRRKDDMVRRIRQLTPSAWDAGRLSSPVDRKAPGGYAFAERYQDLLTAVLALQVLQDARPLRADAVIESSDAALGLNAEEIDRLRQLRQQLRKSLLQLVDSKRPDWGYGVLVDMARLIVVDKSIRSGRLLAVDIFADDSPAIGPETAEKYAAELQMQLADALRDLTREKTELQRRHAYGERDYSYLERAVNRYVELLRGLHAGRAMRLTGERLLPVRSIALPRLVTPALTDRQISMALRRVDGFEARYLQQLWQRYRYNLLTRNCVTELFRTIQNAFAEHRGAGALAETQPGEVVRREVRSNLGGYVDPLPLNFIPFLSYQAVQSQYHTAGSQKLPSYRLGRLEQLYARENAVWVALREGNTLSSTLYKYNAEDSFFVFFTDDTVLLRPFYGAVNTMAGVAESLFGLLALPFDAGKTLKSGVVGILMSLPELAFFNMRKGTYRYLPEQPLALVGQYGETDKNLFQAPDIKPSALPSRRAELLNSPQNPPR